MSIQFCINQSPFSKEASILVGKRWILNELIKWVMSVVKVSMMTIKKRYNSEFRFGASTAVSEEVTFQLHNEKEEDNRKMKQRQSSISYYQGLKIEVTKESISSLGPRNRQKDQVAESAKRKGRQDQVNQRFLLSAVEGLKTLKTERF